MQTQYLSQNVFFLLLAIILIHGPSSFSADKYSDCGKLFKCGNIRVGYPFWGSGRPEHCGHPKFQLNCTREAVPEITLSSYSYRVLDIYDDTHMMKVVRREYWNNVCPQKAVHKVPLDTGFTYTVEDELLTLFYSCNLEVGTTNLSKHFNCSSSSGGVTSSSINYFVVGDLPLYDSSTFKTCKASAVLHLSESEAATLQSTASRDDLIKAVNSGFRLNWDANDTLCEDCQLFNSGRCGYNHGFVCYDPGANFSLERNLAIGIPAAVIGFGIISAVILCIKKKACATRKSMMFPKKENKEFDVEAFIRNYASFTPKRYSYSNVKRMTNSFAEVIGKGGFGSVYKGKLPDGRLVAVKDLKGPKSNGSDFLNEVASIGRISHINIVTLLGFCYKGTKRVLIYEYMPNGSLDKFIFNQESESKTRLLGWKTSYEIALGIARGLEYLHLGCNTRILHFDIKPQNILLDEDFRPKISDFGLAKLWRNEESFMSMKGARGTVGYIAPEVFNRNFGGVSHKSDVYSYGMLVLELVGGRKNIDPLVSHTSEIYFPYWIYEDVELGKDLRVLEATTEEEKELSRKMVLVSFWCIQTNPLDRPSMNKVVDMLQGNLQSIQIPPKPVLSSPARSPQQSTKC